MRVNSRIDCLGASRNFGGMLNELGFSPLGMANSIQSATNVPRTPIEALKQREIQLTAELKDVKEAISALEKNPEIASVLSILARATNRGY